MKKQLLNQKGILAIALLSVWSFIGCENDDPEPNTKPSVEVDFAISTVSGAWPDQTTYIQGVESLDFTSLGNENAIELTGSARTVSYEGSVYAIPSGAPANLIKYSINTNGVPEEEERIVVPGANTFSTLYFESGTVAYGTVAGGISKLIIFDPSTMRITDEVSLTAITQKFPEATRTYYMDMIGRDGKLFMGIHYENNFAPVNDNAYVAVIDLSTNTVEKVISDTRTGMFFNGPALNSGMILDANGNIYVQTLGTTNAGGAAPSGVLRIKSGETDFDPDYFFDLEEAVGNICYGIYHTSSGRTFTANVQDETDFWEYATGEPQFKYVEIDLEATESLGNVPGLPTTYGSRTMIVHELEDQKLLFTIATNDENAVYEFDTNTNTSSKLFVSTGGYISGLEKLN
ncbi:DUF4374 domain-containing protein [Reichenbachiella agariperforans]|uniref:DUF4374 domain-containing protein n=1 Tax=Reichenbachiella agariperforans TaxID=156994 RepID=UPI001C094115|nr:DUF4374 domain-containing protein [Reichenbachiella agariperforans]MBU2912576.1 DUF4374 domain-containing protein [Reichenbachiella agariperforans]